MEMWPGRCTGTADQTDTIPRVDLIANLDFGLFEMAIQGRLAVTMVDDDVVTIARAAIVAALDRGTDKDDSA